MTESSHPSRFARLSDRVVDLIRALPWDRRPPWVCDVSLRDVMTDLQGFFEQAEREEAPLLTTAFFSAASSPLGVEITVAAAADAMNICAPHVATLPDGSKVNLPAGTVLREGTSWEGGPPADPLRDLVEAHKGDPSPTSMAMVTKLAEQVERATLPLLVQSRRLLERARWWIGGRPPLLNDTRPEGKALTLAIDEFLSGKVHPTAADSSCQWCREPFARGMCEQHVIGLVGVPGVMVICPRCDVVANGLLRASLFAKGVQEQARKLFERVLPALQVAAASLKGEAVAGLGPEAIDVLIADVNAALAVQVAAPAETTCPSTSRSPYGLRRCVKAPHGDLEPHEFGDEEEPDSDCRKLWR